MMILLLCVTLASLASGQLLFPIGSPPTWSPTYTVEGVVVIPYAEIEEPFVGYADMNNRRSRVDYYGGMDKTFQRADVGKYGTMFKVVPETTENVKNEIECFIAEGSEEAPVETQTVLPDLTGFSLIGTDIKNGEECDRWVKKEVIGDKMNKYQMWVKTVKVPETPGMGMAVPIHYEMKGYNSLLGSHYDHYYLSYENFSPDLPKASVFEEYKEKGPCHGMPGPGATNHVYVMNPMREYVNHHSDHLDAAFDRFKKHHDKSYPGDRDHDARKDIYRHNLRFIHSKNRQGLTYTLEENHMADWTSGERRMLRGKLYTPGYNGGQPFQYTPADVAGAPDALDWRLYGAVTPVKDQSMCGSCWSFGTLASVEGTKFLHTGSLTRLSQQALVDCSWGFGNNGCDGGEDFRVYKFMMAHGGIPSEEDYGPYLGQDGFCHLDETMPDFAITGYVNVTSGDNAALKVALAQHGPMSVSIDAGHRSLSFYSRGVYYEKECNNTPEGLDHSVAAVGYGELNGEPYWLIKNSWSTYWGNDGYVLMAQKDNNCGVATMPTYAVPKK